MIKNVFIQREISEKLNISRHTIAYYTNIGLVTPEIYNPIGRGTTRKYSRKNLLEFLLIKELGNCGVSLEKIKEILERYQSCRIH